MITMGSSNESKVAEGATNDHATTRLLRFLSAASNEQLVLIALALAFGIYIIIDGLFILLLGALGGVILHTICTDKSVRPVVDLYVKPDDVQVELVESTGNNFENFRPKTAIALNELVDAIVRDYVKHWYNPILPSDETFLTATRLSLTRFILSMSQRLSRKRPADTFLNFLTNSSSIAIVFLNELANATSATQGTIRPIEEMVTNYLIAHPNCNLANIMNEKQQKKQFQLAADDILQNFLGKSLYDSGLVRIFLREILAGVVLEMTLKSCSKPEFINGWIVYLLEDGEPGLGQAIDEAMERRNIHDPFSDIGGNVSNVSLARSSKNLRHQRRISDEEATNEALAETKRISMLIAEEEAKKLAQIDSIKDEVNKVLSDKNIKENIQPESTLVSPTNDIPPHTPITDSRPSVSGSDSKGRSPISSDSKNPISPISPISPTTPATPQTTSSFTNFDQIVPPTPIALQSNPASPQGRKTVSLTLHNANIIIYDDSVASDKGKIKIKPTMDYMVQIEPESSIHPGWMIVRRYSDFETLHEVLARIAKVSGAKAFIEQHQDLPKWKSNTKPLLRGELERYVKDALVHQALAESEGMKRFLEKDQGIMPAPVTKAAFAWPTSSLENMGKGMIDTLKNAPKGAAAGVTGVFSNIGSLAQKRSSQSSLQSQNRISAPALSRVDSPTSSNGSFFETKRGRLSEDSSKAASIVSHPGKTVSLGRKLSRGSIPGAVEESGIRTRGSSVSSHMSATYSPLHSRELSQTSSIKPEDTPLSSPTTKDFQELSLPPPPTEMPDDYTSQAAVERPSQALVDNNNTDTPAPSNEKETKAILDNSSTPALLSEKETKAVLENCGSPVSLNEKKTKTVLDNSGTPAPLNEEETKVAIELLFAAITELYTLSSAWTFRRTLLTAAKAYLLRPGNPSLSSIQVLIQDSVIAAYTSDAGIASSVRKLRENALPTETELKTWPAEMSAEDKEKLRVKARKLLIESGMPIALTGVMGQAATGEALGKLFDALQCENVARGLICGMLLQGVKAITH
ncbi:8507d4db-1b32-4813-90cb-c16dc6bdda94-CDS [Sclerotinia trifoliorum]|uniref:8507d4db-1b32-4813-90cb-c16dc6bdda94-CDS n=1 Tax=Sclerotinia trifoliorum TaxID=28548 RepID=A0A8H2ZSR2_9HELO|nr:8507d4db-1b32-4813-90cb-c16dc6bdda94-CDS [Sclerotinia trifoliorum]